MVPLFPGSANAALVAFLSSMKSDQIPKVQSSMFQDPAASHRRALITGCDCSSALKTNTITENKPQTELNPDLSQGTGSNLALWEG